MTWSQRAISAEAGVKNFESHFENLLQAANRSEREDVYAEAIKAAERILFPRAYELAGGNQAKAARWLVVARQTVREKLAYFGADHRPDVTTD